ncbi:hypothetical protein AGOR_G00192130 [Albula goreensis]|uniref:Ig-like domain-containing protein n=1 Tax=Albula goreensis TaxID=1534307 RepID=A0A8T3CWC8_9TELE|nr:hypothetical protein AGOR_G00192130 [Albula goreensis]
MKYLMRTLSLLLTIELSFSDPQVISLPPHSTLILPCLPPTAPKVTKATFSWTFTPLSPPGASVIPLYPSSNFSHISSKDGGDLSFLTVGEKGEGIYTCISEGRTGERLVKLRKSYEVKIYDASDFELLVVKLGEVGGEVQLRCFLSTPHSGTAPQAIWYRETEAGKKTLYPSDDDARLSWASSTQEKGDWSVIMSNVTVEDSGVYGCEQVGGSMEEGVPRYQKVELTVIYPPTKPPSKCIGHDTPWPHCAIGSSQRSGRAIMEESMAEFSFKLYSDLIKSQPSQNLLISPISISVILTHLLLGARGDTQSDLENVLCFPSNFSCLHHEMKSLTEEMRGSVEIASNIYYNPELNLNQFFINQSQHFYGAMPVKLTNDSKQNVKLINDWVAEQTNQKITDLMTSLPPDILLVLLNTVYFNGKWKMMFEKRSKQAMFTTLSGDMIQVPVLYSNKYSLIQKYNPDVRAQVAVFPLSGKARLFILLPRTSSQEDLTNLERRLDDMKVRKMVQDMDKGYGDITEVTLPKIHLDIKTDLMDLLGKLGLPDLFAPSIPNLCGLSSEDRTPPIVLSDGQHRAFISLSDKGVEAGAASAFSFSRSYSSFSALRPFVLILWSDQINCPLFIGRVAEP